MKLDARKTLVIFLQSWKDHAWGRMFEACQKTWAYSKAAEDLNDQFSAPDWRIKGFQVVSFTNTSNTRKSFSVELSFADGRIERHTALVYCESSPYNSAAYGDWGVNPVSVLKNFGTIKAKPQPKKVKSESKK